jgi:glycosyltransferase involved in cell wall biosynthesis
VKVSPRVNNRLSVKSEFRRVLFLADVPLNNPTSGAEQVLNHQAVGIAQHGIEVCAITRHAGPPMWSMGNSTGVTEVVYRASAQLIIRSLFSMAYYPLRFYREFQKKGTFRAVISHQPFTCFTLLTMRRLQNTPLLYVFHSPSHEEFLLSHPNKGKAIVSLHAKFRKILERLCLKKASTTMVLSQFMKQKLQNVHSIPGSKIVVNPGGVDLSRFTPPIDRGFLKVQLYFPKGKIHLLTVRNLEPRMGIENLLMGIHMLRKHRTDIHLILGGEGERRDSIEKMIEDLSIGEEVTMTGFIPQDLLPQYYGAADFFILPTKHLEGFGLVTPESMACGTPVLGTPVGGTREILSGFDPTFLFQDTTAEAMVEGIQGILYRYFPFEKNYDDLRTRCREYAASNYSWERHISQLKSIIENI